jgi:LysR family transcriptional regulator, glycine cleavage system transcriptional activator
MPAAAPDPSDVRFPSIEGLRAFESVARLGSCERAADELSVTASAISKRVATLEDLLGTPLFNRSLRTLALTAAGREYLEQVRAALGLLAAVPLHRRQAQRVQRLRVSSPPTFARQILVPALTDYTAAHPEVELEIVLSIPYIDGGQADADVEIRNGDALAAGVDPLMEDVLVPLASPGLLARLGPIVVPADLAQAPLLRTPLEPWTPWFRAAGLDWHEPTQGPRLVDLGLTLEAAVCGQGVALARPSLARHWLRSGALVPLLPALGITARPAHLYYAVAHSAHEPAFGFIDWLAATASDLADTAVQELLSRPT